ncbi:MAG: hypothetical protein JWQ43_600, partial [Glaciihabitans sp.]|nr:hypothetical protein [Glaciihabitans sp.]
MGREFTITVAAEIDDLERNGHGPLINYNDLGNSGASRLSALENPGSEWRIDNLSGGAQAVDPVTGEGLSVNDLSGRVLESLGQYPDAAMDFLTDSSMGSGERTIGAERLAYWYGERDFSGADQFEGPAALWLGAQQIDGGPFDVEQGPYAMDRAAMLTSDIMFTLATNDNYRAQNLSEDASGMLATNVAVHLDGFTEFLYDHDAVQSDRAGSEPVPIFGTDENRATPKINLDVFLNVIGPIGANDQGSTVLETAATANQARYIDLAIDRPDLLEGALRRINALQGAVDGSATGSTIKSATDHDAIVEEQAEAAALLVSLLPLPPLLPEGKVVLEVTQDVVDFAISQGIDVGMDELKNAALTLDATIADMDLKRDEQNLMMEVRNGQLMYLVYSQQYAAGVEGAPDMSDVAELPIQKENEDKEDYVQRASRWYYDNMDKYTPEGLFANYNAAYGNSKDTTTRDDD